MDTVKDIAIHCGLSLSTVYRMARGESVRGSARHREARELLECAGLLNRKEVTPPRIGFAGYVPVPGGGLFHEIYRAEKVAAAFAARNVIPRYIPYHMLKNQRSAAECLAGLDGLMISCGFLDAHTTLPLLRNFPARILVTDTQYQVTNIAASQAVPDFFPALQELHAKFDFSRYESLAILSGEHRNSTGEKLMIRGFAEAYGLAEKLRVIELDSISPEETARRYFTEHSTGWKHTLLLSLSEYFSRGVRAAFGDEAMPDLINFDNYESYETPGQEGFFTSVDFQIERMVKEEVAWLFEMIQTPDLSDRIIKIPSKAVIRKSVKI